LIALSPHTGKTVWTTEVTDDPSKYLITSAPLAYRDLVVTGVATTGGRGFVVAYEASSGKERWRFTTIPGVGEPHNETWAGDSWREGGAPTWLTGTYDPELDILYWGVGNPRPDYDASSRKGDNLYSNSVVALNGTTGKLLWHFQFTPGDNHDWDSNQIPVLADRNSPAGTEKLLYFANRNGFYYVLNRVSGKFLSAEPFVKQTWTKGITAQGRPLPPPTSDVRAEGELVYPGSIGGTNWWPPSLDPALDLFFVPVLEQGMIYFNSKSSPPAESSGSFYTAIRALNARSGKLVWEQRSEARREMNHSAGVVSSKSGLLFGSDMTSFFALDSKSGARLWSIDTGAEIRAAPIMYEARGQQFVTVLSGDNLLAFSLLHDEKRPSRPKGTAAVDPGN
jgi:alcohol dehydrogenase (cytochrome c)